MKATLLLLLLLSGCGADPGGTCRLDKLAEVPVRLVANVPVVTVEINGRPASMVVDTGSDRTVLTRMAAGRLGVVAGPERHQVGGAAGLTSVGAARVDTLAVGGLRLTGLPVLLTDAPAPPIDGLLGIDVLVGTEMELDVPHRRLALYRARTCPAALPAWSGPVTRLPAQQQAGSGHLFVSLEVDGQPLRGMLDTGASASTLSIQAAEDAGLHGKALQRLPQSRGQAVNPEGLVARQARFGLLRIGSDTLERPALTIGDLPAFAGDLLVGMDYLGTRRVWFWFLLGRVFVAPG